VLAFDDEDILTQVRLAVLIASLASGVAGAVWLSVAKSRD
jgi:Na+/H+ antiporter NhaA